MSAETPSRAPAARTARHWFMSIAHACGRRVRGRVVGVPRLADLRNLPGRYITELPPSLTAGSTTLHVCVVTSSTRLAIGSSAVDGREDAAVGEHVHVRVERQLQARRRSARPRVRRGSKISGSRHDPVVGCVRVVAVGAVVGTGDDEHPAVREARHGRIPACRSAWLQLRSTCCRRVEDRRVLVPTYALMCPPATRMRPSASGVWPAQKRFDDVVRDLVDVLATGSQTIGLSWLSIIRSFPLGSMTVWIGMMGSVPGALHCPSCAGSGPPFETVTSTAADVVSFPAASRETARSGARRCRRCRVPIDGIRCREVLDTEIRPVELELHAVDAHVVGRVGRDRDDPRQGLRRSPVT